MHSALCSRKLGGDDGKLPVIRPNIHYGHSGLDCFLDQLDDRLVIKMRARCQHTSERIFRVKAKRDAVLIGKP
jgi:hypothetical protein